MQKKAQPGYGPNANCGPDGKPSKRGGPSPIAIPPMFGGFLDNNLRTVRLSTAQSFNVFGQIVNANPNPDLFVFERDGAGVFNDLVTIPGTGTDGSGDGIADTFQISEPLPPNDVPTSPSPSANFEGGTVTYTGGAGDTPINGQFVNNDVWLARYNFSENLQMVAPGGVRRVTVADNNSPVPRDRVHFDYRYYNNVNAGFGDIHRYTFGFEKGFFYDWFSIDARLPFAAAWDSVQFEGDATMRSTDFGNITLFSKFRLIELQRFLMSGGVGVAMPTGPDSRLFRSDGTQVAWIENEAFHLLPFFGAIWLPTQNIYLQSFVQVDLDMNGNTVYGSASGGRLPEIGEMKDSTLLSASLSGGYWIYRSPSSQPLLQGLAAIAELNYSGSMQDSDPITTEGISILDPANRLNVFNFTSGLHAELGRSLGWTTGVTLPLRSDSDKRSDWELASMVNWYF